jgi:SlyX protein
MGKEIVALQERLAHQELALDELTRQSLAQAELIRQLQARVAQLEGHLRELSERVGQEIEDAPPPHY